MSAVADQELDVPGPLARAAGQVAGLLHGPLARRAGSSAPVASLFAAMATEIHYVAAQLGQASESGRLDPPLLMGLVMCRCPVRC